MKLFRNIKEYIKHDETKIWNLYDPTEGIYYTGRYSRFHHAYDMRIEDEFETEITRQLLTDADLIECEVK